MATATEQHIAPTPQSQSRQQASVSGYFRWKGLLDRTLALVMLVPSLPIIGILIVITRLSSSGPGIFKQRRVGKDGRVFTMYKIRTMRSDAEAKTGAVWCATSDSRITRVGYWLRRLHLDEFPQLVNVLRGEMSLVGPRPERPEFVEVLAKQIPCYYDRLSVAPGITGLAQVNLPPDTDLNCVRRKLVLDLEYIATASLLFDLRMIMATFLRLMGIKGGRSLTLMRLHRQVELPADELDATGEEENPCTPAEDRSSSLRDTVSGKLIDTVEFEKLVDPAEAADEGSSESGDSCDDEDLVSPAAVVSRVSKSKPK